MKIKLTKNEARYLWHLLNITPMFDREQWDNMRENDGLGEMPKRPQNDSSITPDYTIWEKLNKKLER